VVTSSVILGGLMPDLPANATGFSKAHESLLLAALPRSGFASCVVVLTL